MKNGGGHFAPKLGGHFELESGGHFKLELGGQYHWNLHQPQQKLVRAELHSVPTTMNNTSIYNNFLTTGVK